MGTIINLFADDLTAATPAELTQAIVQLAQAGVEEKFRLDFKETWEPDKQCPDIAAFANSYGGLLILGVSNDRLRFPGIASPKNSDLKTQVASVIATRITPVPIFEVHTCPAPENGANYLIAIRVSAQPRIHLYLKGDRPVYVRSEDKSIPANASHLQALLDRVRSAEHVGVAIPDPMAPVARDFFVTKAANLEATYVQRQVTENRRRSETFCLIAAVPEHPVCVSIDVTLEQSFRRLVFGAYPSIDQRRSIDLGTSIAEREDRASSWYRYHHLDLDRDHEAVWAFGAQGTVQYVCEVAERVDREAASLWSVVDLFVNLESTIRLVHEFWTLLGYFGAGQLAVRLSVPKLVPACNNDNYFPLFYETPLVLQRETIRELYGSYAVSVADTGLLLAYDARAGLRKQTLVTVGNQLLRDLRFGIDTRLLRESLDLL